MKTSRVFIRDVRYRHLLLMTRTTFIISSSEKTGRQQNELGNCIFIWQSRGQVHEINLLGAERYPAKHRVDQAVDLVSD